MEKQIIPCLSRASASIEHVGEIIHNQYKQPVFINSISWEVSLENTKDYGASCPGVDEYG